MQFRIETDSVLVIRRRHSTRSWCPDCAREVEMIQAQEAVALAAEAQNTIPDSALNADWHLSPTAAGSLQICLDSVLKSLGELPAPAGILPEER